MENELKPFLCEVCGSEYDNKQLICSYCNSFHTIIPNINFESYYDLDLYPYKINNCLYGKFQHNNTFEVIDISKYRKSCIKKDKYRIILFGLLIALFFPFGLIVLLIWYLYKRKYYKNY